MVTFVEEEKEAYPYITKFKKEPFRSFVLVKKRDIGDFYLSRREDVVELFKFYKDNLLKIREVNLENIYWFLLLGRYLKQEIKDKKEEIYDFIKKCEISMGDKTGFVFFPNSSQKIPDIFSTYFALTNLKLLGSLKEYLSSNEQSLVRRGIKNFIQANKKGNSFLHCLDKNCEICKNTSSEKNIYFSLEILRLLDIDTRLSKDVFRQYLPDKKRDSSLVFKLLSLKYLDLEYDVKERTVQYLQDFQKENGGYSFKKINGRINTTFWIVYALDNYAWLTDYNPVGIYSFINYQLNEIVKYGKKVNVIKLMELSKIIILLSILWKKFIQLIERAIFKQLERKNYIEIDFIQRSFGLIHGISEVISYINQNYKFNLKIKDNQIEFNKFLNDLSPGYKSFFSEFFNAIRKSSIYLFKKKDLKRYKSTYRSESFKLKEDIIPLINEMIKRKFFEGNVNKKWGNKFYFYLDYILDKIIVSDTEINTEKLYKEKDKLKEIKNDIYNMTLKLKHVSEKVKVEIESYLILEEIALAKERLKFILRDALMEADFLNENIENSFNLELYYHDIQIIFKSEIDRWKELYSVLTKKLNGLDSYLKTQIAEKEELKNLNNILEQLDEKIFVFNESINRKLNDYKKNFSEILQKEFNEENLKKLVNECENLKDNVKNYDDKIYEISQKIYSKSEAIIQKRSEVINKWITISKNLNEFLDYYINGFSFFNKILENIYILKNDIIEKCNKINDTAQIKVKEKNYKEAFEIIKNETDNLFQNKIKVIKTLQENVSGEIKLKQKLYLLFRYLLEKLEGLENNLVSLLAEQEQLLKNKVIEERNRSIITDLDDYVSKKIGIYKNEIRSYRENLDQLIDKNYKEIVNKFEDIQKNFEESDTEFLKKLENCKKLINDFEDESKTTIKQWYNFKEYFISELNALKNDFINKIIAEKIKTIIDEKKTNTIKILDLKKELGLKCSVLMEKIKDMIEISKLNGQLYEAEKCLLIFTEHYYKNKELKNFIDNKLLKLTREVVGKILALYDSSIRNRTLSVNLLELQNRINDLHLEEALGVQFTDKTKELQIDQNREEFLETKKYFKSILNNNKIAIESIKNNLAIYANKQTTIILKFEDLKAELNYNFSKTFEEIEKSEEKSYVKIKENFESRWKKIIDRYEKIREEVELDLKNSLNVNDDLKKLGPELGEFFVLKKNDFMKEYEDKKETINAEIRILKDEYFRGRLIDFINERKIRLSQMLGTLQSRVEDDIEAREFKRANVKIKKRANEIDYQAKLINKNVKNLVKEFSKYSNDFEPKNKYVLSDLDKYLTEFNEALMEKTKSLEHLIVKAYINMAIKAVSNEFLTIGFLNHELKIKKQNLQDYIIYLISIGDLKGKYEPRLGLYYENPEILKTLDEDDIEVFKMNFHLYTRYIRLKSFLKQNYIIFAFIAAVLSITYTLYQFTGGNPVVIAFPVVTILFLVMYFFFIREKEEKVKFKVPED